MMTIVVALFFAVMAAVTAAGLWWNSRLATAEAGAAGLDVGTQFGDPTAASGVTSALQWVGDRAPKRGKRGDSVARHLSTAGYRTPSAGSVFRGIKLVCTVVFAFLGSFAATLNDGDSLLGMIALGALGYFLPDRILKAMAERRMRKIRTSLPSALDLLVLSIEAGQSLDMALMETARGIRNTHPDIASELALLNGDLRANTSRADAMRMFWERTGEAELKKLANLLSDTDRFGTSLGPALRNHSRYLRIRVRQHAQEAARKVGVKLIFPVFFLIFPSVILVTLGPAVIMVAKQMKTYMAL